MVVTENEINEDGTYGANTATYAADEKLRLEQGKREQVFIETANVLLVGDHVNLFADQPGAAFGWATVVCVTDSTVELVRPHIHTSDFTIGAGGGIHCGERLMSYIGTETVKLDRQGSRKLSVVFRSSVPK